MENPPNNKKALEQEKSDLQKSLSEARESTEKATKRMEELLATKKLSHKENKEVPVETAEGGLNVPDLKPKEIAEYFNSRSDQTNYYVKAGLSRSRAVRQEIIKNRGILVSKYLRGEISAEDMLAEKPFGYERNKIVNDKDLVKKIVDEEVAYWGPKLGQVKTEEEIQEPVRANAKDDHATTIKGQEETSGTDKESVEAEEDAIEAEPIDISNEQKAEDAELMADENTEKPLETKEPEEIKENPDNKKTKTKISGLEDIAEIEESLARKENLKNSVKENINMLGRGFSMGKNPEGGFRRSKNNTRELGRSIKKSRLSKFEKSISEIRTPSDISLKGPEQTVRPTEKEVETEIKAEIKAISQPERAKIIPGIHNLGFRVEKKKNEYFAKTFDWLASKQGDQKGTMARFIKGLSNSYKKESEAAEKKARLKNPQALTKISNVAYIGKNILRPVRLIMDATGVSPLVAHRAVMAGAMMSGRATAAMKEARLANEEVLEKNRLEIDQATEEAWGIYERAIQDKSNDNSKDSHIFAEDLQNAYLRELPQDIQKRLEQPTVANGFLQNIFRKHMENDVDILNLEIIKIEENKKLTPKQKKAKIDQKITMLEKKLLDYDRMLARSGEIDEYAMAAKYAESTSKNAVRIMTVETLYLSVEKLWAGLSQAVSSHDFSELAESIKNKFSHHEDSSTITQQTETISDSTNANAGEEIKLPKINMEVGTTEVHEHIDPITPEPRVSEINTPIDTNTAVEQFNQNTEGEIQLPKINMEVGTTEVHEHIDPIIKIPGSGDSAEKLEEIHSITKDSNEALIEQARQKVEEEIKLPKINMDVKTTEVYEHVDPKIKLPESTNNGQQLDQLHDVIKNEVNGDVIVTSRTPDGENVIFGTRNIRPNGINPDTYAVRGNPDVIVTSKSPDGENVIFGSRNARRFDIGEQFKLNMETIRQNNAFIVHNIEKVFPENTRGAWNAIKSIPAREILETSEQNAETQNLGSLITYLKRLEDVTGLEPKGRSLFNWKPESTEDFIKRAVEWARMNGQLKDIEIQ